MQAVRRFPQNTESWRAISIILWSQNLHARRLKKCLRIAMRPAAGSSCDGCDNLLTSSEVGSSRSNFSLPSLPFLPFPSLSSFPIPSPSLPPSPFFLFPFPSPSLLISSFPLLSLFTFPLVLLLSFQIVWAYFFLHFLSFPSPSLSFPFLSSLSRHLLHSLFFSTSRSLPGMPLARYSKLAFSCPPQARTVLARPAALRRPLITKS